MLAVVLFLVVLNAISLLRHRTGAATTGGALLLELLLDVAALTTQLYLSGGASNPFVSLYLLQVILAAVLLEAGEIGSLPDNVRRFFSRFLKCYVSRQGYKGGGFGFLVSLCAGLFPLLAHLQARLEPERYRAKPPDPG